MTEIFHPFAAPQLQKEEFQHTPYSTNAYVTLGPLANQLLHGKKKVKLEVVSGASNNSTSSRSKKRSSCRSFSSVLESKLDNLRKELASLDGGIFPHSVLSTQQIDILSSKKPKSIEELEKMIGKVKTEKYGLKILEEINTEFDHGDDDDETAAAKKLKISEHLVLIQSSDDDYD